MEPLSPWIRSLYLIVFGVLFLVLIPVVIMYAEGWRFTPELGLYKTGGIYITVPYTNTTVSIEGRTIGRTGIVQRSFYVDDLPPATYVVRVTREGYYPSDRMVVVEPQLVTEADTLLVPLEFTVSRLAFSGTGTTTKVIARDLYTNYERAFATTTENVPMNSDETVGLLIENGNLAAAWMSADKPFASNFCSRPSRCETHFYLEAGDETVESADFFGGGVVYDTKESGVSFIDVDIRPTSRVVPVYGKPNVDFRVIDGALIVKDGTSLYEVSM